MDDHRHRSEGGQLISRIVGLVLLSACAFANAALLQKANLVYKGTFTIPSSATCVGGSQGMDAAAGGGMGINPVSGTSLFIGGHPYDQCYAEISIPTACRNGNQACSGTASYVQPLRDAGLTGSIGGEGTIREGGVYIYNSKMYNTLYTFYSTTSPSQASSHFRRPVLLTSAKEAGPVNLGGPTDPAFLSGYMGDVSAPWQAAFGGPSLTGQCCLSIISRTSSGPAAFVWNPEAMGSPAAVPLLYYPLDHSTLGVLSGPVNPAFNGSTIIKAVFMPDGTDTVAFVGQTGTGLNCYKEDCPPIGVADNGGWNNQRHEYYLWLYDAADLAAVKAGTKQPWEPVPYAQFTLSDTIGDAAAVWNVGAAYNPATEMLYVGRFCPNWPTDCRPSIAAYSIEGLGVTTYTVTPSAGANGTISPNTTQTVNSGSTTTFTVTPSSGYTASVGGTCGGSLVGTTYTTNAITANCTVSTTFADTTAPTTPTNLDARSDSTSTVDLSWVASTDAVGVTSYRVDYCSGFGCSSWATLGTSATNSYTHTGITPATNPTIYRYRVYALDAANNLSGAATSIYFNAVPTIPAFPGAEGGGAASKGGRGGTVYHVTSLDGGTGAGTLRACVAASGPRTCVFDVAGNIELTGNINISLPYITIAGHTAPGGGITISGKNSTQVSLTVRTHNVTIRGIRIRKGYNSGTPDQDGDSVNVLSASATASPVGPVIFDHVSISWGQDENAGAWALTTRAPKNITYQWVMMYEPLLAHPVNFMTGAYNNATAERMTDIDVHHSIFANSSHRNPLIKNKTFRLVNNLIYNWGDWASAIEGTVQADLIGNRYKTGPLYQTISSKAYEIQLNPTGDASTPTLGSPSLYVIGNVGLHNTDPLADNWGMTRLIDIPINAGVELGPLSESYRRFTPLAALPFPITVHDVMTAETIVLAGAGASRRLDCSGNWVSIRDSADARIVAEYTAGNAGIIPANETAVGGYPALVAGTACTDTDGDGMPDTWETANGLNINSATDGPTLHASGYSNLEMYLAGPSTETTPVLSNLLPTSNLARTATSATLQATTDQTATCRYALGSGTPYAGMTPFTNTANTAHSSSVSVVAGGVYQYCVRCMGTSLVSDESCTRFAVDPNPKKRVLH